MIAINRFKYNGYSSKDFDLKTCLAFDTSSGETNSFLTREAVASESYKGDLKRVYQYKYNEVLSPVITLIKEDFEDFTLDEQRRIFRWLTSKSTPSFLTVYHDDSEVISYEILGAFTEIQTYKIGSGRVVGFQCTYESVSPYAFSALQTITKDVSNPLDNTISVNINSDELVSLIYPRITIEHSANPIVNVNRQMVNANKWVVDDWMDGTVYYYADIKEYYYNKHNEDGTQEATIATTPPSLGTTSVVISNVDDVCKIAYNTPGEKVIIDGANRVISRVGRPSSHVIGDDFNWTWMPLYNGTNTITVIGNCTVTLEYRVPIKCGEF